MGEPIAGRRQTLLTSDAAAYGGKGWTPGRLSTTPRRSLGHPQSLVLDLPPLTAVIAAPVESRSKAGA